MLTSSEATAVLLQGRLAPGARVLAIGEEGLVRALLGHGFRLVDRDPEVVVCGLDRRLTYERLTRACFAIRGGAPLIATNPDLSLPTEGGLFPGNGATLAYLRAATGVTPEVIGKPEATMLRVAMERLGSHPGGDGDRRRRAADGHPGRAAGGGDHHPRPHRRLPAGRPGGSGPAP